MIEAILLQIPPPVQEAVQVCSAYHRNCLMYVKHILLHHLVIPLLDLIQSPYHGIIVTLVVECPLHVHQQVRTEMPGYPQRLVKMWGQILASLYCSRKASTSKCQSVCITSTPGSVSLKIGISNLVGTSHFLSLLPLWPLHLHWQPTVSLTVEYPSESGAPLSGEDGGEPLH